jgi:dTDP-4-dehydrorhamnose reductase
MKALITGANGTVGARLRERLQREGMEVRSWDRSQVPVDDYWRMEAFVRETAPDVLFHLAIASKPTGREGESWLVNYEWPSELAWITRQLGVRFVFTSTAMVFSDNARGPFTITAEPDAKEGYGHEKRRAEERVLHQNPNARVVRLGWQIDDHPQGNTMTAALEAQMRDSGVVRASDRWYPACSFLDDTAAALQHAAGEPPGLYMADSNERWTHFEIAGALSAKLGRGWRVEATSDFIYDQRLIDARLGLPSLKERLPTLP